MAEKVDFPVAISPVKIKSFFIVIIVNKKDIT